MDEFISVLSNYSWFYLFQNGNAEAPLILWLQGGPGATSLFGMFTEIGPYKYVDGTLDLMPYSWNQNYSLIFIDNPVGTGK